jgi:hypothetical protein
MYYMCRLAPMGISWKESLNSDGQQFHQYQQSQQSFIILSYYTLQRTTTYDAGNQGDGLGQARKYGGNKPVNVIAIFCLVNWNSNSNTYLNKR